MNYLIEFCLYVFGMVVMVLGFSIVVILLHHSLNEIMDDRPFGIKRKKFPKE